jgi:predicted ATP-binding protein involved in virulence
MKINQINIKNFKGFADRSFALNDHFTVFIGDNAAGKTTVLDALSVALGGFFINLGLGLNTRPIDEKKEVRLTMVSGQSRPQLPVTVEVRGQIDGAVILWKREIQKQKTTSKDARSISTLAHNLMQANRRGERVVLPVLAYHGTGRLWAEHEKIGFLKQNEGLLMAYANCLSPKSSSKEFLAWFKTQEDSIAKFDQPLEKAHLAAFKQTLLALIPDDRWQDIAFDRKQEELMGVFTDNQGQKHKLSYRQLSDGFRMIIGLAADIAYRCIQLNPHLGEQVVKDTPGIVLIDELDIYLHPNWQKRIVGDLKRVFPNIQFVATTHSPFIVQSLESDELINLDSEISTETKHPGLQPIDMTLNQVATEIMQVKDLNSDNFEDRFDQAKMVFEQLQTNGQTITTEHYGSLKELIDGLVMADTEDPVYKAFLSVKNGNL